MKRPLLTWAAAILLCAAAMGAHAFDLQGHRGARGLLPENTLESFQRALEIGVTTLELDIAITADGVPVVHHDQALNPNITRDAEGKWLEGPGPLIKSLTLAQLQTYDVGRIKPGSPYARDFARQEGRDGVRVPTLAALFQRVKELGATDVHFAIETKIDPRHPANSLDPEAFVQAVLAVIREHGMSQRSRILSFDWRSLQAVQKLAPGMPTVYITIQNPRSNTLYDGSWTAGYMLGEHGTAPKMVKAAGGTVWSPNFNDLTSGLIRDAKDAGIQVMPWTVNEPRDIDRVLGMGVDGIITDYPDRVREAMQRRGMPLPKPIK